MAKDKAATRADAQAARNLDPAHVMDFSNLHLDHPPSSKRVVTIVDLDVYVYGLDEIEGSTLPVAAACLSHGWANKAAHMEQMAYGVLGEALRLAAAARANGRVPTHDMIVVTVDHRNHGPRRRNPNGLVFANNPARLIQAHATLVGAVHDHQLVMDSLGAYLWPRDERVIDEWMFAGVSLGGYFAPPGSMLTPGHLTWRMLRDDDRVRIGAPIISIPPERLAGVLTRSPGVPPPGDPHTWVPRSVRLAFERQSARGAYAGKKILSLHGALDQTIPHALGAPEFERIRAHAAHPSDLVVAVHEGAGHVVTPNMVRAAAEWFWRWGCSEPAPSAKL